MHEPWRHYSLDEYFIVESDSTVKHEYFCGEIFAMGGASVEHNHITANVLTLLRTALRGTTCNAFGSDLRVSTPSGLYTYPDVSVICGRVELVPNRPDTAANPVVLFEVLSDATRDYDRGEKFDLYKAIPTLREYVLIEQQEVSVQHFTRGDAPAWPATRYTSLSDRLPCRSVSVELPLAEIYRQVFATPS